MSFRGIATLAAFAAADARAADRGSKLLAIPMIGNAEGLDLGDRRVGEEKFLDFARIDVLAASDNHVL